MKSFDIECREGEGVKKKEEKCCVTLFRMGSTETVWRNRVSCQVIVVKAAAWINMQTFQMIDPLNILNQNILKPRTSALYFSFLGVEKGGRGAAQNNNFQRRKIPTTRADTCFLYSPPNRVQSSQTALSEKASTGSEMRVTRKNTRGRGVAEASWVWAVNKGMLPAEGTRGSKEPQQVKARRLEDPGDSEHARVCLYRAWGKISTQGNHLDHLSSVHTQAQRRMGFNCSKATRKVPLQNFKISKWETLS